MTAQKAQEDGGGGDGRQFVPGGQAAAGLQPAGAGEEGKDGAAHAFELNQIGSSRRTGKHLRIIPEGKMSPVPPHCWNSSHGAHECWRRFCPIDGVQTLPISTREQDRGCLFLCPS